jgi:hypothetical protein
MEIKTVVVALVLSFALILLAFMPACANLTLIGAKYEANITPGQHVENEIKLNLGAEDLPVDIMTDILGLGQSPNGVYTMIKADQDDGLYTARPFLNVSPSNFHLDPGETKKILISGDVPSDIGEGSRYAMASIRGISKGSGPVGVSLVLNVPILLTISDSQISQTAEISELNADAPVYKNQKNATLTMKNTGNTHYRASVNAIMKDDEGNIIANSTTTQPNLPPILPDESRKFALLLKSNTTIMPGIYSINATAYLEDGTILANDESQFNVES